jgi:hypothetical protein
MKPGWYILLHLLGLGCIAADIAIIATLGQADLSWVGWVAIGFYWWLGVGVAFGWLRFVGQPLSLIILGVYVMATLLLLGIGFSPQLSSPSLLLAFAPLATALIGRIILDIVAHRRKPKAQVPVAPAAAAAPAKPGSLHDSLF